MGKGLGNPSLHSIEKGDNKNLCISGADAKQVSQESWSIVIFEKGVVREMSS